MRIPSAREGTDVESNPDVLPDGVTERVLQGDVLHGLLPVAPEVHVGTEAPTKPADRIVEGFEQECVASGDRIGAEATVGRL
jgi:hypothetical protein